MHLNNVAFRFLWALVLPVLAILLSASDAYGQCANIAGQASGVSPGVGCSPHIVNFTTDYDVLNLTAADIAYEVDWGDGNTDEYVLGTDPEISTTAVNATTTKISLAANHTFFSGTMCRYEIAANLRFDGVSCTEEQIQPVVVWDNDNVNGGTVAMTPDEYEVCAGSEVTVNFTDATDFNCTPPDYLDSNPNFFARTYAFEYGTFNSIANIEVDGAPRTYPYYDGVVFTTNDDDLVNDGQLTYDIFVPATANVGEQFEVTLYYWNFCNPFNGNAAAPNFADAEEATALITIVPPPEPLPEVFDANEDYATNSGNNAFWYDNTDPIQTFCSDQTVYFRQAPAANPGTDYEWDFDWDGTIAGFNTMAGGANANFSYDALTYSGQTVEIGLKISRGDVGTPCIFYESIQIEIEAGPQANFDLDITEGCNEVTFNTTNNSNDADGYQWSITQASGPAGTIEDISAQENNVDLSNVTITGPGEYEVTLLATSTLVTSCPNSITKTITIYDDPVADFNADNVCFGDDVIFEDLSNIPNTIAGDLITTWEFVFDFDNTAYTTDPEATFDAQTVTTLVSGDFTAKEYAHTYPSSGTYNVALRVTTVKGCVSAVDTMSVIVKNNPISNFEFADNGIDYTQPLCPGDPIEIKNTSPASQTDPGVDRYYVEIVSEDNANDGIFPAFPASFPFPIDSAVINPTIGDLPNPNSGAPYTYEFYFVAVGDNNCESREGPLSVTLLPAQAAGFEIFEGDPGPAPGALSDTYDNLGVYCSPYEFYFRTDANTQTFNADEYIWTITDGIGDVITQTTVSTATNPTPERFNFNFENVYPSVSQEVFNVNLQVITDDFCVTDRNETVRLFPKPTGEFVVQESIVSCDTLTYIFKAVQETLDYFWSVSASDNSKLGSAVQDDVNATFTVKYGRPSNLEPDLDFTVELYTENLVLCQSETETMDFFILAKEDIEVVLQTIGTESCSPATFGFVNNTTDPVPAGTEWQLIVKNLDSNDSTIIEGNTVTGNEEFRNSDPADRFQYEFLDSANYEVSLNALLPSTCDVTSDPPVSISIGETPEMAFRTNVSKGCAPLDVSIIAESSSLPSGRNFNLSYEVRKPNGDLVSSGGPIVKGPLSPDGFNNEAIPTLQNTETDSIDYEVTLIGESFAGCRSDSTVIVRVYQQPEIDFDVISPNPACQENFAFEFQIDNAILNVPAGTNFIWNWGDGQSLITDQDTVVNHTFINRANFLGQDSYTVTLNAETTKGCVATVSKTIILNPLVSASFFKSPDQGCAPLDVNFTSGSLGTGLAYIYEKRIKGSANPWESFTATPQPNGAVTENFENTTGADIIYEVRHIAVSSVGGCSDTSDIQEIIVYPEFSSPEITGPDEVCAFAQSVPYSVPLTAGSQYIWQLPLGAFKANENAEGNEIEVNFSNFTGDIQVQEVNANGCFGEPYIKTVNVLTGPSATLSLAGPNAICAGDNTSLRFDLTGPGSSGFDVIYNNGQENDTLLNISDGHIETVTPVNSTNYFLVDVTDLDYPSCNPSGLAGSAFVNVNTVPTASISGSTTLCEGNNTNLIINLTGLSPWDVSYTDGTDIYTIDNINNPVTIVSVNPTEDTNYELLSVTDNNTPVCSGTVSGIAEIKVNKKPTAEIFGNVDNVCQNDLTELDLKLTGTPPWTVRYTNGTTTFTLSNITPDTGYDPAADTYTYSFDVNPVSGTNSYSLTEVLDSSSPFPCSGDISGTATVTAYDRPEVELTGNATLCQGESTPLSFDFNGDGPFNGNYTANGDTIEFNNLQDGATINVTPAVSTVYRVIELFDSRGCFALNLGRSVDVNVNQRPSSTISGADTTCFGEETNLIFDQTGVGPWKITYRDGSENYNFTTSFNRHFEPVRPTKTTTYTLISVVDSSLPDNCTGEVSGSANKIVYPLLEASFDITPQDMVLPNSTINITNKTTNKSSWTYLWEFGDGTTSEEADPLPHDYGTYGEFTVKMTATNGQCTDTYETVVTIGAIPPIIDFDATPKEGCLPLVVTFENLSEYANPSTYQWDFGDGQKASAVINPIHVYTNPGTYNVRLSATNITGQRTELLKEELITVYATPQASFTIPDEYRQVFSTEEVRFVNLSEGADQYIWKFGDGNESFEEEPIHAYADSGVYDITLIAINSETGCSDSVSLSSQVKVLLGGESEVPNAFTPSRAGPGTGSKNPLQNDYFLPRVEGVSQFNMKIYNRWGELLFESNDEDTGWDGYYNGVLMPQGVYVYRLELAYENGRRETKVGDVTLIR